MHDGSQLQTVKILKYDKMVTKTGTRSLPSESSTLTNVLDYKRMAADVEERKVIARLQLQQVMPFLEKAYSTWEARSMPDKTEELQTSFEAILNKCIRFDVNGINHCKTKAFEMECEVPSFALPPVFEYILQYTLHDIGHNGTICKGKVRRTLV